MAAKLMLHHAVDKEDTPRLTVAQGKVVIRAMQRVCIEQTKFEDIVPMEGFPEGYFRWKPSEEVRYQMDCEIRCVFRKMDNVVEVVAVSNRGDVYSKAARRMKALR